MSRGGHSLIVELANVRLSEKNTESFFILSVFLEIVLLIVFTSWKSWWCVIKGMTYNPAAVQNGGDENVE